MNAMVDEEVKLNKATITICFLWQDTTNNFDFRKPSNKSPNKGNLSPNALKIGLTQPNRQGT
jgi:hypothetical protein